MSAFAAWLAGFAKTFLSWLYNSSIDLLQGAIDGFCEFIISVVSIFPSAANMPSMPSVPSGSIWDIFITCINWLFPVAFLVSAVTFVVAAMVAYIVIMPVARWLKLLT